jgi:hypothetical protein
MQVTKVWLEFGVEDQSFPQMAPKVAQTPVDSEHTQAEQPGLLLEEEGKELSGASTRGFAKCEVRNSVLGGPVGGGLAEASVLAQTRPQGLWRGAVLHEK